jgi:hypothetical protein
MRTLQNIRPVSLFVGAVFGFAATLTVLIDGSIGLIAGPLSGIAAGIFANSASLGTRRMRGFLGGSMRLLTPWIAGFAGCIIVLVACSWLVATVFAQFGSG